MPALNHKPRLFDIEKIRAQFPILEERVGNVPLVYLDSGATAQKPQRVIDKIEWMYSRMNANVHRGVHHLSVRATEEYEAARETVRGFLNAESTDEIIFTAGATAAINMAAFSFGERFVRKGDNVVVSEMEHHSNIVPWQMMCARQGAEVRVLPFDDCGRLRVEMLETLIDERTRLVAVTQAGNVLGTRPDIAKVVAAAHARGAAVLVDGCQGVVHGGADVRKMGCDFYAFSGHKLYGPTGTGVLWGRRELLEQMPPFMGGGDMIDHVSFAGTTYAGLPLKFEAGTANYVGAVGLAEAVKFVQEFDAADIELHEQTLLQRTTERLSEIDGLRIYGTQPDKCAIVSFTIEGTHTLDIGMILDKMGIAIRTGSHCAEPVMTHFGVTAMCRASFAIYNKVSEVDALADGLVRAVRMLRL